MGLTASILALGSFLGSASIAEAATFSFSTSTPDTITGTIVLPDGDGSFVPTSVTLNSVPAGFEDALSIDFATGATAVPNGVFVVVAGAIDAATTSFLNTIGDFTLTFSGGGTPTVFLDDNVTPATAQGAVTYAASTPEPTSVVTLIGVGVLGVASKKFKKKA